MEVVFDGDNSFPDCEGCGTCCAINVIAVTNEEYERMRDYMEANGIQPIDYGKERCCFNSPDGLCMVWEARSQTCKLHHCKVSRNDLLKINPDLVIDDDKPLLDMHDAFILGQPHDPRYCESWQAGGASAMTVDEVQAFADQYGNGASL